MAAINKNLNILAGDQFLIEQKLAEFKKVLVQPDGFEIFNFQQIDLADQTYEELLQAVASLPLGNGVKMVVVKGTDPEEKNEDYFRQLKEIFSDKKHPVYTFFIFPGYKIKELTSFPLYQLADDTGGILELVGFSKYQTRDLADWIQQKIKEAKKILSQPPLKKSLNTVILI